MAERVCPVWIGYLLISPIRKLMHNPQAILAPHVKQGMTVLDVGSAMGFFSIPIAQMVGERGKVICVDMQEGMLKRLEKRARKAGVADRIESRLCAQNSLGLQTMAGKVDLAVAFFVVHEVPDQPRLFAELSAVLKPSGQLLVVEPKGHVSEEGFQQSVAEAQKHGFAAVATPQVTRSRAVLFKKA